MTKQARSNMWLAVGYYGIVGLIGAVLGAWFVLSLVTEVLDGYCEVGAPGALLCDHSLQDFFAPFVASLVGVTLLPTAMQLRRNPPELGPVVGLGVVVGIAMAVLPIVLILWAADSSGAFNIYGTKLPTIVLVIPFVGLLLWALASALIVWRQAARAQPST